MDKSLKQHLAQELSHDDIMRWKYFLHFWPFCRESNGFPHCHWRYVPWSPWHLKSPTTSLFVQLLVQAKNKENSMLHIMGPLWKESTGDWWFPCTKRAIMQKVWPCHDVIVVNFRYCQTSNTRRTLVGNEIVDQLDVVGAACRHCSNYIFSDDLITALSGLSKCNCKTRRETFNIWDLVQLLLEILW